MTWDWAPVKADANFRKHGVSFELALRVFDDPFALTLKDPFLAEERWRTLGKPSAEFPGILFVVHTETYPEGGRIISARLATPKERREYEKG